MKWFLLIASASLVFSSFALADAQKGEMFGYRIGDPVPGFTPEKLIDPVFGGSYVVAPAPEMSGEFDELQLYVTPLTGRIVAMVAQKEFEDGTPSDEFLVKMAAALRAKFGPNRWRYVSYLRECTEDGLWRCTHLGRDVAGYLTRQGDFTIELLRYKGTDSEETIHVRFAPVKGGQLEALWLDELMHEYDTIEASERRALITREKGGLLRGIE